MADKRKRPARRSQKSDSANQESQKPAKQSLFNKALSDASRKILTLIDSNYEAENELEFRNTQFQEIINREMDISNGVSNGSIIDFIQAQREKNSSSSQKREVDGSALFTENIDQVYNYLLELYTNKYSEMLDLKYIRRFIPSLGQALKTTLNHVCSADDIADGINRNLTFDIPINKDIQALIESEAEQIEKDLKLLKQLKNFTYKGALGIGSSYIYRISYRELFEEYEKKKNSKANAQGNNPFNMRASTMASESRTTFCDMAIESVTSIIKSAQSASSNKQNITEWNHLINETSEGIRDIFDSFHVYTDTVMVDALEGALAYQVVLNDPILSSGMIKPSMEAQMKMAVEDLTTPVPDGTKDPKDFNRKRRSSGPFDVTGSYVRFIDSGDMVPLKVFNQTVGYYHIVSKKRKKAGKAARNMNGGLFSTSLELSNQKKEKAMDTIVDTISDMIMQNFNQKFLSENQEFKNLIADCILAKGIADNEYSIQFIPSKYVYEFKINEDADGNGESLLSESLFSGKILLSYLVAKLMLFVNNAGDKTLVTMHRNPIDLNGKNQLDRVIRDLEGQTISFGDFLSPNIMFNKFNRNANVLIPTSLNGSRMLDFEKLEGKDINMQTDMEEKLERSALIGSSVPETIMDYNNDLQFSRQIVSTQIKYAGDVASLQSDLEEPTTELYRDLLYDSTLPDEAKQYLPHLHFGLPRPKVITNTNNNENIRTMKETAEMIAEMYYGQEVPEDDQKARLGFILEMCKVMIPYYDWKMIDEIFEKMNYTLHEPKPDGATDSGSSNPAEMDVDF